VRIEGADDASARGRRVAEARTGAVLEATLERITFANPQTGYTVARVDTGRGGDLVTVVGSLLGA
jgi:exodeoxyribonuclease V alpha subunit